MTTDRPAVGVVGAGGISRAHLPGLLEQSGRLVIHSMVGADALAAEVRDRSDVPVEVVSTLAELLAKVDVVDVVTPTFSHHDVVAAALEAGRHVLSEKPLALTVAEARELVELAERKALVLFPAHVVRYFPEYLTLKTAVDSGELGELAVLRFVRSGAFPRVPWFADPRLSGGIIVDQMIHDLDQARWIAGEVTSVSAVHTRREVAGRPHEAAYVLLRHRSGAISQCSGIWGPPHLAFTTEFSASGDDGVLQHSSRAERPRIEDLEVGGPADGFLPAVDPGEDPYALEIRDFLAVVRGGGPGRVTARDGMEAVRIARAATESVATGQPVVLAPMEGAAR